jgi:hypothetical protein
VGIQRKKNVLVFFGEFFPHPKNLGQGGGVSARISNPVKSTVRVSVKVKVNALRACVRMFVRRYVECDSSMCVGVLVCLLVVVSVCSWVRGWCVGVLVCRCVGVLGFRCRCVCFVWLVVVLNSPV